MHNCFCFGQIREYKLIKKEKFQKIEKSINKNLSKDSLDARSYFVKGVLYNQKKFEKFNPEIAYLNFQKSTKYYYRLDDKNRQKIDKEGIIPDTIFYHREISFELGLKIAISKNTIEGYQHFIDYYVGATTQRVSAENNRNVLAFQVAQLENTEDGYINFLQSYPNALQTDSAIKHRDGRAFETAKTKKTSEAIVAFLRKYPTTHLKLEANHEKNRWFFKEQTDGTVEGYIRFCKKNERGVYFDMSIDSIECLSLANRDVTGLKYLTSHSSYLKDYSGFQDKLFNTLLFDGHPITFNFVQREFGNDLDAKHRNKLENWTAKINEIGDLFFKIGVTGNNRYDYMEYIRALAPLDIAWVALQRLIEEDVKAKNWVNVKSILAEYESIFDDIRGNMVSELMAELSKPNRSVSIEALKYINTNKDEYAPVPSIDGNRLFFCGAERKDNMGGEDIFEASKTRGVFSKPKIVPSLSTSYENEAPLSVSADGNSMFLWTGENKGDIQMSNRLADGSWSEPISLPYPINSDYYEGDAMLSADGKTLVFVSTRPGGMNFYSENKIGYYGDDNYPTDIYVASKQMNGEWDTPYNLGAEINTHYSERGPYLHPDGKTLYFSSEGHSGFGRLDVFMSERDNDQGWGSWSKPVNLGKEINSSTNDWGFKFSTDGKNVFYAAKEKSVEKSSLILLLDVSGSMREGNRMSAMKDAARELCITALANNTEVAILAFDGDCYAPVNYYREFSDDAKELTDFIVSLYPDGGTPMYEALEVAADYMKKSASKDSKNKSVILMSDGDASSCSTLKSVMSGLQSKGRLYKTYTIALGVDDYSTAYEDLSYIASRSKGAFFHAESAADLGNAFAQASNKIFGFSMKSSNSDVFTFTLPEDLRPQIVSTISGVISNSKKEPISANIFWEDLTTGENMGKATTNPTDGSYFIVLPTGRNYGYFVDNDDYFPSSNNVDLRESKSMKEIKLDVDVVSFQEMIDENKSVKINNLFFETAKFELKPESFVELNRITTILKKFQDYKLIIEGHTDNVGNEKYNLELSEKRAQSVVDYLISKGYDPNNISYKGYGFSNPENDNSTVAKKALNRRVEIKLIKR